MKTGISKQVRRFIMVIIPLILAAMVVPSVTDARGPNAVRNVSGFNENEIPRNDDGSSDCISLGFTVNFFGRDYSCAFVNNNGNITFDRPLPTYTPFGLEATRQVIIAAFFADVDTRVANTVKYGDGEVDGRPAFGVNSIDVGYFNQHDDKLNDFQLILIDRSDIGRGNFDIEFNYDRIEWETGDASRGVGGLGGFPVRIGYSNGTGERDTSFELEGSNRSLAFLDSNRDTGLIHNSLNSSQLGRYRFEVRNGRVVRPPDDDDDEDEEEQEDRPALVTVVQRPTPNLQSSRASADYGVSSYKAFQTDDGIVEYEIEIHNQGEGAAGRTIVTMPFDPAEQRVLDARFSQTDTFVSSVVTNSLEITTGRINGDGGVVTGTVRLLTRPTAALGAELGERLSYRWEDARNGGTGTSNRTVLTVGETDANQPTYPLGVTPSEGPAGATHVLSAFIFAPGEIVTVWYHTPDNRDVEVGTYTADGEGRLGVEFTTPGLAPGSYFMVAYGNRSRLTGVGPFVVR